MNIRSNPDTTLPAVTTGPLASSRKIFVAPDEAPDLRVPLREIILSEGAGEPNLPVYDTSGPYTDPAVTIDLEAGLPPLRAPWLARRGLLPAAARPVQPADNGFVGADRMVPECPAPHQVLVGAPGKMVTQFEFARAGIITAEMEYIAIRENIGRARNKEPLKQDGNSWGASIPD